VRKEQSPFDIMLRLPSSALNSTACLFAIVPDASRFCTANTRFNTLAEEQLDGFVTGLDVQAVFSGTRTCIHGKKIYQDQAGIEKYRGDTYHGTHNLNMEKVSIPYAEFDYGPTKSGAFWSPQLFVR
jgi:hypothetical protein